MTVMSAIRSAETEEAKNAADRIAHARALLPQDEALTAFFDALYASAVPDDVLRVRPDQLAALAVMLHGEALKRPKGTNHVVALDWSHETVLLGINDDRPFLFDSALAAAMAMAGCFQRESTERDMAVRGKRVDSGGKAEGNTRPIECGGPSGG